MDEDGFKGLRSARVAIIGLGLMGGSLALALKDQCASLIGIDHDPTVIAQALINGVVERASTDPATLLPVSDVVILATPVETILRLLDQLPDWHPGSAVVMDLGSTKRTICQAMAALPARFEPVGGHPMCGREKGGLANASADLYRNAPFALSPLARTTPRAKMLAGALASAAGAHPIWLDPTTHDHWAAFTSHLPYLAACSLALSTPPETRPLIGPGFHSTTRVAATSSEVMLDILINNADETLAALADYKEQLGQLEAALLARDWENLKTYLERAAALRQQITAPHQTT